MKNKAYYVELSKIDLSFDTMRTKPGRVYADKPKKKSYEYKYTVGAVYTNATTKILIEDSWQTQNGRHYYKTDKFPKIRECVLDRMRLFKQTKTVKLEIGNG